MIIPALSLTQPWAAMVALLAKGIETRSWQTRYTGPIAIHAAKGLNSIGGLPGLQAYCTSVNSVFYPPLQAAGLTYDQLPLGAIVAVGRLVMCYPIVRRGGQPGYMIPEPFREFVPVSATEAAMGDYSTNKQRYAWLLADVKRLAEPIPARGQLSLWQVEIPDGVQYVAN